MTSKYNAYLAANPGIRKLHIGCGSSILPGWLNCDYSPVNNEIMPLDATREFPFDDNSFDYIFSEHMIEHITFPEGAFMLSECFRVLKSGGTIRISTPNLAFLFNLCAPVKSDIQKAYIQWAYNQFIRNGICNEAAVINNFVRAWGHKFIYDPSSLAASLKYNKFSNIKICEINESEHDDLRFLENEKRLPPGFLKLETMTLEAAKL